MSYALGQARSAPGQRIHIGQLVKTDPIMSAASLMSSRLLLDMVRRPQAARLGWLRDELNKSQTGLGNDVVSKFRALERTGVAPNQALFDGMRLTFANFFAKRFERIQKIVHLDAGVSGLGESVGDIRAAACLIMGTIGAGGTTASALLSNPAGSEAIGTSTRGLMTGNSCDADSLRAQADVINAQAALATAQGGTIVPGGNMPLIIAATVGGVALLGLLGFIALKK